MGFALAAWLGGLSGCGDAVGSEEQDVVLDTETELAWAQYLANLEYARGYEATCSREALAEADHRVLVTGYGRFLSSRYNATGGMVSALIEELEYPLTEPPPSGEIDPPGPQTAVAQGYMELPGAGRVAVCAMVLPVYWDLAPYLLAKEMVAFEPDMLLMNGIAGYRQATWLELGATNRAKSLRDGSDISRPDDEDAPFPYVPLIPDADESEVTRPNLASWEVMRDAMLESLEANGEVTQDGTPFSDVVQGALLAGFPRLSNTYLCNNVTYTVGYLMDHHDEEVTLMEASHVRDDVEDGLPITLGVDMSEVPRLFMHWSSGIRDGHLEVGAEMMRAAIDAQLMHLHAEEGGPVRGDEVTPDLPGSPFDNGTTH
jgi:pyrrolidone-carboxylate peptidase